MTEGVAGIRRKPTTLDEFEAPIPRGTNVRARAASVRDAVAEESGLQLRIRNGYVTLGRVVKEAAIGTIVYGGVLYAVYVTAEGKR